MVKIPVWMTNVVRQADADRLIEKIWRARVALRKAKGG